MEFGSNCWRLDYVANELLLTASIGLKAIRIYYLLMGFFVELRDSIWRAQTVSCPEYLQNFEPNEAHTFKTQITNIMKPIL